ncbi:hypothetical protein J437_LFUL014359 [Ladona fulva]|uniref:Uncharacterized protein n=1 Tax=Ladona fulva TaxID=123851 RepID=A0A8K0KEG0_LADFU|nr:hypothetical protein J437_LFUL014359 [Ladona fulva]
MKDLTRIKLLNLQHKQNAEQQMEKLIARLAPTGETNYTSISSSSAAIPTFDPLFELWKDYWARFQTFARANSVHSDRLPQIFLTNQPTATYKLLSALAAQQSSPKDINELSTNDIASFMEDQFDPR